MATAVFAQDQRSFFIRAFMIHKACGLLRLRARKVNRLLQHSLNDYGEQTLSTSFEGGGPICDLQQRSDAFCISNGITVSCSRLHGWYHCPFVMSFTVSLLGID